MSRIVSGKMRLDVQPVRSGAFIEAAIETVRPAAEAKGVRLSTLLDPAAGPVNGDPSRLQQVVWNLLSNAIKFTARDGRVQVAAGARELARRDRGGRHRASGSSRSSCRTCSTASGRRTAPARAGHAAWGWGSRS